MNLSLIKKMLPGLIPLFIFILADEIWGTMVGLYVALGTGIAEFLFYFIRDRIIDRFILLDTMLLVVLGAVSIIFENDLFFKIKPALIETILLAVIAFSLWGPKNIMMAMSERYMGEIRHEYGSGKSDEEKYAGGVLDYSPSYRTCSYICLLYVERGMVLYKRGALLYFFRIVFRI